jgi:hypothetical protein
MTITRRSLAPLLGAIALRREFRDRGSRTA